MVPALSSVCAAQSAAELLPLQQLGSTQPAVNFGSTLQWFTPEPNKQKIPGLIPGADSDLSGSCQEEGNIWSFLLLHYVFVQKCSYGSNQFSEFKLIKCFIHKNTDEKNHT